MHSNKRFSLKQGPLVVTPEGRTIILKDAGKKGLLRTGLQRKRQMIRGNLGGRILIIPTNNSTIVVKIFKRKSKENGITQMEQLQRIHSTGLVRTPKTYFATPRIMAMEHIKQPTLEEYTKTHPKRKAEIEALLNQIKSTILEKTKITISTFNKNCFVEEKKDGQIELILIDPIPS